MNPQRVFLREATGLVRNLGVLDTFVYGVVGVTPGLTLVVFYVIIPFLYPGVDMLLGIFVSVLVSLIFGLCYWSLAASMPRSGGDYVYGSRIIHPLVGFWPNWVYVFTFFCGIGFWTATLGPSYVAVMLAMLGNYYKNPSITGWAAWSSTLNGAFILALIAVWISALINVFGIRVYAKAQNYMFIIAMLGIVIVCGALAMNTNQSFQAAFNAYSAGYNTSYNGIIEQAKAAGWQSQPFSFSQTMGAVPYIAGYSLSSVWPIYAAGETRNPHKSIFYGTVVAIAFSGAIFLVTGALFFNVAGNDFAKALGYISNCGCTTNPLPVGPYIQYLSGILVADNPLLLFLLGFGFVVWGIIQIPAAFLSVSRSILAWSFDRMIPAWFADVSDRFHVPLKSILIFGIGCSFTCWLAIYSPWLGYAFNLTLANVIAFSFAGVIAAVFPYVKRARYIYEAPSTPAIIRKKIGGVPLITWIGVAEFILFAYQAFIQFTSPALAGPVNPASLGLIVVMFASAAIVYFSSRAYHKRVDGINIDMAFVQLPPE